MSTKFILRNCVITVNGVDLTDHCSSVEVGLKKDAVDTTNFAGGGKEQQAGLTSDQFVVTLQQDYNASEVNSVLQPLQQNNLEFPVTVKPALGATSATNPLYTGTCILLEYTPLSGKPGALAELKLTFPTQRTGIAITTS